MSGRHSKGWQRKLARMEANTCTCGRRKLALLGGCPGHTTKQDQAQGQVPAGVAVYRNGRRLPPEKAKEWLGRRR